MFCRTNRRCFFFIRTIFQIRNIPVKSIVRQYPLSQWNHILCQYTSDISPKYNIHIVCHPKIGYQDSKMIQISFPFLFSFLISLFQLFHKYFQRIFSVPSQHTCRTISICTPLLSTITSVPSGNQDHMSKLSCLLVLSTKQFSINAKCPSKSMI